MDTFIDNDIQLTRFVKKRELFINPILRKKNQEVLPANSNPNIYHGQCMKEFLCAGHSCQNFEQWVVTFTYLV